MPLSLASLPDWALPERILDPKLSPDAVWAKALADGDQATAVNAYMRSLREGAPLFDLELSYIQVYERVYDCRFGFMGGHHYDPDEVVKRHYVGVYGIEHTFEGEIDWLYDPTIDWGDAHTWEWQVQLNRHYQWVPLARAWQSSGDTRYAKAFENELLSWVGSQCPAPARKDMSLPGTWRTIEAGIRGGWTWPYVLEIFRQCPAVSDQALWLMVAAYREHGHYLLYSPTGCNFKTMETISLAHAGLLLPGLRDSQVYASTALDRTIAELERQFYDDGLQVELAPSYGVLSAACSFSTLMLARQKGLAEPRDTRLPPRVWRRLAETMTAYARVAMPDGFVPDLHDNNRMQATPLYEEARKVPGTELPARPPFNEDTRTDLMPWGGYGVLCREGRYSFLDGGPWGAGHQHADALQVLTWSHGGRWLCDPGKPLYDRTALTQHIRSAAGHNVVLLDGVAHRPDPLVLHADAPFPMAVLAGERLMLAAASRCAVSDDGKAFTHERLLLDLAGVGWVVLDFLRTDAAVTKGWEWLWHFTPGIELSLGNQLARASRQDGERQCIQMAASSPLRMATHHGGETPLRGWSISPKHREHIPLPVLQARSESGQQTLQAATVISPSPVEVSWATTSALVIDQQHLKLERLEQVSAIVWCGERIELPPHHLPAADG